MKIVDSIDVKMYGIRDQLKIIEAIEDLEEQGYQAAPLICQISECDAKTLMLSVICHPDLNPINQLRDKGMLRWCKEQQATLDA